MKVYRIVKISRGGELLYRVDKNFPFLFINSWTEWSEWKTETEAQIEVNRLCNVNWNFPESKIKIISEIKITEL